MRSMLTLKSLTNCLLTGLVILLKMVAKSSFITKEYSLEKTTCRYLTSPVSDAIELFFSPALAADLGNGAKVFSANCASCHMGVKTSSMLVKPLKKMHWQSMEWIR
jgi:cytochrome c6